MKLFIKSLTDNYNLSILPLEIKEKIDKFVFDDDKKRTAIAWTVIMEQYLLDYNKDSFNLYYNEYQKPYIKEFFFNISHHNNIIAIIISDTEVGIDVSGIGDRKLNLHSFRNCFTEREWILINNEDTFHKFWSVKEAFIKYLGKGLSIDLRLIDVYDDYVTFNNAKYIYTQQKHNEYYISYFQ